MLAGGERLLAVGTEKAVVPLGGVDRGLPPWDPVHLAGGPVEEGEGAGGVARDDACVDAVEQRVEKLLAIRQRLGGLCPLASVLGFLNGAAHGRRETREPLLEHVVGRSALEALDRGL